MAQRLRALLPSWPLVAICAGVFALVFILWRNGRFQSAELRLYDRYLKSQAGTATNDSPVIIIGVQESDLDYLDAPMVEDDVLSSTLESLTKGEPAAIVVDFYRDKQVKGNDPKGREKLADVFARNPNIIAIERLGLGSEPAVKSPPFLPSDQIGFNDFPVTDPQIDGNVRRVTLMMWESGRVYYSDPLMATLLYLQTHEIEYDLGEANPRHLRLGQSTITPFKSNDGAYVDADARGYQMLLDFRGPTKFPVYTLVQAFSEQIPLDDIRGKVVLLGPFAPSMKDYLPTPMAPRFEALLLHAHLVDQLVRMAVHGAPSLRHWSEWQETFWLLLWCFFGTLTGSNVRSPLAFVFVAAGCLGLLGVFFWLSMLANLWVLVIAPAAGFTLAAALSTSHQVYLEKRQRDVLMDLFSQHVSTNVATDIWSRRDQFMDGHRPRPQVLPSTVIFTDLKGFTGTAEALPPEALIDWLNEYMEVMAALIDKHGGMINKYMGDAIMAVFGAPIPRLSDEEIRRDANNAARCAIAMGEHLDRLNEDWARRGLPTTMMRVGIASGDVVSGSIGGARRLEYTVTGDTVVIAKRLEGLEKDATHLERSSSSCRVLIAERTFSMLDPKFKARKVGPMHLDGKLQIVNVYVLTACEDQEPS